MKMNYIRTIALAGLLVSGSVLAKETVTLSGSTSVTEPMEVLAETYQKAHPDVFIEINGTGSSAGIKAARAGNGMFGMASRELTSSEKEPQLKEVVIAHDGIAVVVNNANKKISGLTRDQITNIFNGTITNWSEVGGENKPIVVITRDSASGTRGAFEELMSLTKKIDGKSVSAITPKAQVGAGNGVVKTIVAHNPLAIGYVSLGSVDKSLKAVDLDGVHATEANVKAGKYPLSRPFQLLYLEGKPSKAGMDFLNWLLAKDGGQKILAKSYIPVTE